MTTKDYIEIVVELLSIISMIGSFALWSATIQIRKDLEVSDLNQIAKMTRQNDIFRLRYSLLDNRIKSIESFLNQKMGFSQPSPLPEDTIEGGR